MLTFSKYFSINFLIGRIFYALPFCVFINIGNDKGLLNLETLTIIVMMHDANSLKSYLKSPAYRAEDGSVIKDFFYSSRGTEFGS